MAKEGSLKIEMLESWETWEDNFTKETKKDVVVSLRKDEEEDQMRRGFHIQVLKENTFLKALFAFY